MAFQRAKVNLPGWREFTQFPSRTMLTVAVDSRLLLTALFFIGEQCGASDAEIRPREPHLHRRSDEAVQYELSIGDTVPLRLRPAAENRYPAELCFWTTTESQRIADPGFC